MSEREYMAIEARVGFVVGMLLGMLCTLAGALVMFWALRGAP